jgi:hypothetical protein
MAGLPDVSNLDDKTLKEMAGLALALSSNKATRSNFLGLVRQAAPDTPIPELDTKAQIEEALRAERAEREKIAGEFRDYRLQNQMGEQKKSVMSKHGLSDEDVKKIEEMMGKKELPTDYEFAARLYKQQTEQAVPTEYGRSGWGPAALPSDEGLMDDPYRWAQTQAHTLIDELRARSGVKQF